jgi:hypothetical protein
MKIADIDLEMRADALEDAGWIPRMVRGSRMLVSPENPSVMWSTVTSDLYYGKTRIERKTYERTGASFVTLLRSLERLNADYGSAELACLTCPDLLDHVEDDGWIPQLSDSSVPELVTLMDNPSKRVQLLTVAKNPDLINGLNRLPCPEAIVLAATIEPRSMIDTLIPLRMIPVQALDAAIANSTDEGLIRDLERCREWLVGP